MSVCFDLHNPSEKCVRLLRELDLPVKAIENCIADDKDDDDDDDDDVDGDNAAAVDNDDDDDDDDVEDDDDNADDEIAATDDAKPLTGWPFICLVLLFPLLLMLQIYHSIRFFFHCMNALN